MITLVTLEEIKKGLVIDFDDDDELLGMMNLSASAAVLNYLKIEADDLTPVTGGGVSDDDFPEQARIATILLVGFLYRNRDRNEDGDFGVANLPAPVVSLLHPLRYPSFA